MSAPAAPQIGEVVRVKLSEGTDCLAVVGIVGVDHPALPPGVRGCVGILTEGDAVWLPASAIVDRHPLCPACGTCRWWWRPDATVCCAICTPPRPNWEHALAELHEAVAGLPPEVQTLPKLRAIVEEAEASYLAGAWGQFQRCVLTVAALCQLLIRLAAGLGLGWPRSPEKSPLGWQEIPKERLS